MTAQTPEHVCNWAVSTFHTKPDCPDFRTSAAQLKQYRWSDVIRFHFCVIKHIFHSFHPQSLFFWATPIALDCRGPISPPKEGEDFSRQNPQFTAQCVGHVTCPTTKYFGCPMTEQKAIHGMTKLLQWGAGSLLEAYSTLTFPHVSPAAQSPCFSQEGDGHMARGRSQLPTTHLSGLLNPLHCQTQTRQYHLGCPNKSSMHFQP